MINYFKDIFKIKTVSIYLIVIFTSFAALGNSDFKVAYLVDDQIITNYDLDQNKKLHNLLNGSNIGKSQLQEIVVTEKIKEIYAKRLNIKVAESEFKGQLSDFLKSNNMNSADLKLLLGSKEIDLETFYNFIRANIRWKKVLDSRFGYKINNMAVKDDISLVPTPTKIEKEYEFSEIFISYEQWNPQNAKLIANRLEIELNAGANFEKAVQKFSSAESKNNNGKVGPIKKSVLPKTFRGILDNLKRNEVSKPFEINGGLLLLKLEGTRSYKTARRPQLSVTYSITGASSKENLACSTGSKIKGPIRLAKVKKNIREILDRLMPGESYKLYNQKDGDSVITLCQRFIENNKIDVLYFENIKKNEEALRLSNALLLELRRNTTVVIK